MTAGVILLPIPDMTYNVFVGTLNLTQPAAVLSMSVLNFLIIHGLFNGLPKKSRLINNQYRKQVSKLVYINIVSSLH